MKRKVLLTAMTATMLLTSLPVLADNEWKASARDAWIDGKAEAVLLFKGQLNTLDINTDVRDGTVILTGKVDSEVDKALATELVESLEGVVSVDNRLTVVSPVDRIKELDSLSSELQDAKIATVIKTRLLLEFGLSGGDIDVDVQQGTVTLSGKVESKDERNSAIAIAKNTDDVKVVISELSTDS